jgi:hypothetical protein
MKQAQSSYEKRPLKGLFHREGDLKSMMNNKRAKGTKDDTMKNDNHHRDPLPPLP